MSLRYDCDLTHPSPDAAVAGQTLADPVIMRAYSTGSHHRDPCPYQIVVILSTALCARGRRWCRMTLTRTRCRSFHLLSNSAQTIPKSTHVSSRIFPFPLPISMAEDTPFERRSTTKTTRLPIYIPHHSMQGTIITTLHESAKNTSTLPSVTQMLRIGLQF